VDTRLDLEPLSLEASERLAESLLGVEATPSAIKFVVERSDGNPLYLVELCSALGNSGVPIAVQDRRTPSHSAEARYLTDQLRSLILSRIDALDASARQVVHVAAVLGHAFPATLLRTVLGPGDWGLVLARLEEHGIFLRESREATGGARRGSGSSATRSSRRPCTRVSCLPPAAACTARPATPLRR
jgi:hypothetical protein